MEKNEDVILAKTEQEIMKNTMTLGNRPSSPFINNDFDVKERDI